MIGDPASELACQRLAHDFVRFVDGREYERLREVFTEDAVFARPTAPEASVRGIDQIIASFASRPRDRVTLHLLTNITVSVESSERATGSCRILLFTADASEVEVPGRGRKAAPSQLIGVYLDRFVRTSQGWRILERRGRVLMHT